MMDKDYFSGYETFNKFGTLNEIKKRINEKSGFPTETNDRFWKLWRTKLWKRNTYNCDDNLPIKKTAYDSSNNTNRYVYIFIDINKKESFVAMNECKKTLIKC